MNRTICGNGRLGISLQLTGNCHALFERNKKPLNKLLIDFKDKHVRSIHSSLMTLNLRKQLKTQKGENLIKCNISLATEFGKYSVDAQDYGIKLALKAGLKELSFQIKDKKENVGNYI